MAEAHDTKQPQTESWWMFPGTHGAMVTMVAVSIVMFARAIGNHAPREAFAMSALWMVSVIINLLAIRTHPSVNLKQFLTRQIILTTVALVGIITGVALL